jgi:hypothetical protein
MARTLRSVRVMRLGGRKCLRIVVCRNLRETVSPVCLLCASNDQEADDNVRRVVSRRAFAWALWLLLEHGANISTIGILCVLVGVRSDS